MSAPRKEATKAKKTAGTRRAAVLRDLEARMISSRVMSWT